MSEKRLIKMLIAGVGGQGVVYTTNLMIEASLLAGVQAATSEIHGLSQRAGSVVAGLTFGPNAFGFVQKGGADLLIGLEALEAQRCLPYLHRGSMAVIDSYKIFPFAVNAGKAVYPDTERFEKYLSKHVAAIRFIKNIDTQVEAKRRNIYLLGIASTLPNFPIEAKFIEMAIMNKSSRSDQKNLAIFKQARVAEKEKTQVHE